MTYLLLIVFALTSMNPKMLVRVYDVVPADMQEYDVLGCKFGEWVDIATSHEEVSRTGKRFEIIAENIDDYEISAKDDYPTFPEFVSQMVQMVNTYPSIAKLDTLGFSHEGRPVLVLKVSDNVDVDEDEAGLFVLGGMHAREWPTLTIPLVFADTITKRYGSDAHITDLVDSRQFWIVPCANPDGWAYSHDQGHNDWRRDRQVPAIDPNRNWNGSCDGDPDGEWCSRASFNTTELTFCGYSPFQDSGIKFVSDFMKEIDITAVVSYHTYARVLMWPWGYTGDSPPDPTMPQIGEKMAQAIGSYQAMQISSFAPQVTGGSDDWCYGYALEVKGANTLSYTVEACNSYRPSGSILWNEVKDNLNGLFYISDVADSVKNVLVPKIGSPEITAIDTVPQNYVVSWERRDADVYELEEYRALNLNTDEAEADNGLWDLNEFTLRTTQHHSGTKSYFDGATDNKSVSAMTTVHPLPLVDSITFWIWHWTEDDHDWLWFEVSPTGKEWTVVDGLHGKQIEWTRKSYPFPQGLKSLYIRFRGTTDASTAKLGAYIDDIYPVPTFDTVRTISASIADTFYAMTNKPLGDYWYRVRGHNSRGWGNFGQLKHVFVRETGVADARVSGPEFGMKCLRTLSPSAFDISYSVPTSCRVSLKIYDSSGRCKRVLAGSIKEPGSYKLRWNAKGLPSGIYFAKLVAQRDNESQSAIFTTTTKLTVLKPE
jgi:hypothetical protein